MADDEQTGSDLTTPDPSIRGYITPAPDDDGAPIFHVIERHHDSEVHSIGVPNVRPCDHVSGKVTYILDEKFHTVTCSKCQTPIHAFAVLMLFAEWNRRHQRDRWAAEDAERSLHVANLRRILKLRGLAESEAAEIKKQLMYYGRTKPQALAALASKIEDAIQDRKYEAERKKNPVKGTLPPTIVLGG